MLAGVSGACSCGPSLGSRSEFSAPVIDVLRTLESDAAEDHDKANAVAAIDSDRFQARYLFSIS